MKLTMEEKINDPIPIDDGDIEAARSLRDIPPAHYTLKFESFSGISKIFADPKLPCYESEAFTVGGYKWKLSLYPNGDKERNGDGYISLYLAIADKDRLPLGWEVNATFKFFVYDQILDKYLTLEDDVGTVRRFHEMKSEYGFSKLLPLSTFKDASNGYLVKDKCVIGAEVFVVKNDGRVQSVTTQSGCHTWKIRNFSLYRERHCSKTFTIRNQQWRLWLYPTGHSFRKNDEPIIHIEALDIKDFPKRKIYATIELLVVNQRNGEDKKTKWNGFCFSASAPRAVCSSLLSPGDIHDASNGFLVDDDLIIRANIEFFLMDKETGDGRIGAFETVADKVLATMPSTTWLMLTSAGVIFAAQIILLFFVFTFKEYFF